MNSTALNRVNVRWCEHCLVQGCGQGTFPVSCLDTNITKCLLFRILEQYLNPLRVTHGKTEFDLVFHCFKMCSALVELSFVSFNRLKYNNDSCSVSNLKS